jgi:hypothetical protein
MGISGQGALEGMEVEVVDGAGTRLSVRAREP